MKAPTNTAADPRYRYGRNDADANNPTIPASNNTSPITAEPTSMPPNSAAPRSDSAATIAAMRRYGQPCAACQIRVGAVATTTTAAPIHSCRRRSSARGPRTAALSSTANHRAGMRNLVCMLIAVTIPAQSSSRSSGSLSRRLRVQRTRSQHTTAHSAGSIAGVCSQWARI
ncbi:Uncharacterised protein [Mycobacteroides abscessus subsp. abscessus]|nr:Uncharacterised protein [Mycobacteroides abscessus subsp. abscessus]